MEGKARVILGRDHVGKASEFSEIQGPKSRGQALKLFEAGRIGNLRVKNRIVMAPMGAGALTNPDGSISERARDYYVERAKGGVGLIITGMATVENKIDSVMVGSWSTDLRADAPRFMSGLSELVEAVHDYGTKIAIQLTAGVGRVAWPYLLKERQPVAPSAVPCFYDPKLTARELKVEEIQKIIEAFGYAAAEIVTPAEFDAIELHGHEGYLFDQFMTSLWNKRTDKYGGDLDGRLNFSLEVIQRIKDEVGKRIPIIYRYGITHYLDGGRDVGESLEIAKFLEKGGVDAIHADAGCYETWYWAHPPVYQPMGCMVEMAETVKKVAGIPVIAVGKLGDPELAERTLQQGKADFIAIGRALLTDPEWPRKTMEGRFEDIRPCIGCHEGCLKRILDGKYLSCAVNPTVGKEQEFRIIPAKKSKCLVVVGGGVAGMEAARVAALRGHSVSLYESNDVLGGHLIPGSTPEFKQDIRKFREYMSTQIRKLRVKIVLGTEVNMDLIEKIRPEVVVVATGSEPIIPEILGAGKDIVVTAVDVLRGKKDVGEEVIVAGGGSVGCETAVHLAMTGRRVSIVEMLENIATDLPLPNRQQLLKMLIENRVDVLTNTMLVEVTDEGIIVVDKNGKRTLIKADTVVLSLGLKPRREGLELLEALAGKIPELYPIGDCVHPRKIINAVWDAFRTARLI